METDGGRAQVGPPWASTGPGRPCRGSSHWSFLALAARKKLREAVPAVLYWRPFEWMVKAKLLQGLRFLPIFAAPTGGSQVTQVRAASELAGPDVVYVRAKAQDDVVALTVGACGAQGTGPEDAFRLREHLVGNNPYSAVAASVAVADEQLLGLLRPDLRLSSWIMVWCALRACFAEHAPSVYRDICSCSTNHPRSA